MSSSQIPLRLKPSGLCEDVSAFSLSHTSHHSDQTQPFGATLGAK